MEIIIWITALILSLFILVKSADYFTLGAENFWLYFWMSSFVVWATIVAIWWSTPELATSLIAAIQWQKEFAIDNVVGSNIANTMLIWGILWIFVWTLKVRKKLINIDLPFFFMSSSLFILFIIDGVFTWKEWIISLFTLLVFILYTLSDKEKTKDEKKENTEFKPIWITYIVLWVIGIFFGAKYTITSVDKLWTLLNIPSSIITIIAVAIGTSLPELVISLRTALKWKHSIALWNIFWSNTFNSLAVVWVPSLFTDLMISETVVKYWISFLIVSTLAFIFTTHDNKIQRWEWICLLILYFVFILRIVELI